jgi:hypothetical protein
MGTECDRWRIEAAIENATVVLTMGPNPDYDPNYHPRDDPDFDPKAHDFSKILVGKYRSKIDDPKSGAKSADCLLVLTSEVSYISSEELRALNLLLRQIKRTQLMPGATGEASPATDNQLIAVNVSAVILEILAISRFTSLPGFGIASTKEEAFASLRSLRSP